MDILLKKYLPQFHTYQLLMGTGMLLMAIEPIYIGWLIVGLILGLIHKVVGVGSVVCVFLADRADFATADWLWFATFIS
jgi:hypothetical protein